MAQIDAILRLAHEHGASDLHLSPGAAPMARVNGDVVRLAPGRLARDALQLMLFEIAEPDARARFEQRKEVGFAYELPGELRVRCSLYEQSRGIAGALRLLPAGIPSLPDLGLPAELGDLVTRPHGLVIVSGPAGTGRSSTLAALLDHVNRTTCRHAITVEDPIEFRHTPLHSLVEQREVGRHTPGLAQGVRAALQEDADVIATCEPRGLEAMEAVLDAAAGRLVLMTLFAACAPHAVDAILEVFPDERRTRTAARLADTLLTVLCHRLLPRADRAGRVLALERLPATDAVRTLIREQRTAQLDTLLRNATEDGMRSMDQAIAALVREGVVAADWDRAVHAAEEPLPDDGTEEPLSEAA